MDYWQLTVSPRHFQEQLDVVRRTRHQLPVADFIRHFEAGTLPPDAVCLTFDDGYVDNLVTGKPLLAKADVPATVHIITGFLDRPGEFWWDELARLILQGNGPLKLELTIGERPVCFDLAAERVQHDGFGKGSTKRRSALRSIWQALRCLGDLERGLVMQTIRSTYATNDHNTSCSRAMTSEEVKTLVADGIVTIGSHTVTHPLLTELDAVACRREITESKITCEKLIGASVQSFAYPFGGFNAIAREEVKNAGHAVSFSAKHGAIGATSDPFALPRINVGNWDGDRFERAIRSAATIV